MSGPVAVCADVGSTFTKVAVIDLDTGELLASAAHPTTVDSNVLIGLSAALDAATAGTPIATMDVCSSAGGGLRLAVVGYEGLVTARAGHQVGLSAGARVVHVATGRLDRTGITALRAARPDVVLLVGGTDGGDVDVLLHNARRLAAARLRWPAVVAGNVDGRDEVMAVLTAAAVPAMPADNVLPRIGALSPASARSVIREVFLRHVIGGKTAPRRKVPAGATLAGADFTALVRGPTPDVMLTGVELLADELGGDLLVVDIGGATTDVYSVLRPDDAARHEVAGTLWHSRSVEGDLGLRSSAPGVVAAAAAERLLLSEEEPDLSAAARARAEDPSFLPVTESDHRVDLRIAQLAAVIAVRRHARGEATPSATDRIATGRRDLRRVRLLVGSGGVLRHAATPAAIGVLAAVLADHAGGWALPVAARTVVDRDYRLAPAGLLAAHHPAPARALLHPITVDAGLSAHPGRAGLAPPWG